MKNYAIIIEGMMDGPETLGTYPGNTAREAFENFLADDPDFEGEVEVYEIGPGSAFRRYDGETEERPL